MAETESCLLGINKAQLAIMQKGLLESGNEKDYFVIESILKGNFLVKDQWRREFRAETADGMSTFVTQQSVQPPHLQAINKTKFI